MAANLSRFDAPQHKCFEYNGRSDVGMRISPLLHISTCMLGLASCAAAQSLPPLVRQPAPGVYYRLSEDDRRIIATTSWIEFRDFVAVIDANFPWGARALLARPTKHHEEAHSLRFGHALSRGP